MMEIRFVLIAFFIVVNFSYIFHKPIIILTYIDSGIIIIYYPDIKQIKIWRYQLPKNLWRQGELREHLICGWKTKPNMIPNCGDARNHAGLLTIKCMISLILHKNILVEVIGSTILKGRISLNTLGFIIWIMKRPKLLWINFTLESVRISNSLDLPLKRMEFLKQSKKDSFQNTLLNT